MCQTTLCQAAAVSQWSTFIIKSVQQVNNQCGLGTWSGLLQQGQHLIAGEGARDLNALESSIHVGRVQAAQDACHLTGVEAVAAVQHAQG